MNNSTVAGKAIINGLQYLKNRLGWDDAKIVSVLHLSPKTANTWLKNKNIPMNSTVLTPETQAIVHLLAIHRYLEAMFNDPLHQQAWLTTMHPELNVIPEKLMGESIDGLIYIRQYLDYVRERGA